MGLPKNIFGGARANEYVSKPDPSEPGRRLSTDPQSRNHKSFGLLVDGRIGVVGESHHQPALKAAARGRTVAEGDLDNAIPVVATLVPEPENKYDRNAVRVDVEGRTVGYLPREIAGDFQPVLRRLHAAGKVGSCHARIMGGGRRNYGIHLHLAPADRAVCANDPGDLEIIGGDRTVTVVGEERHQESIGAIARSDGVVGVFASLAPCTIQKGKYAGAEGIEVRVNGDRVGELTKAMSDRYGPLIHSLAKDGKAPGCEAVIMPSERGYQVELRLPRDPTLQR